MPQTFVQSTYTYQQLPLQHLLPHSTELPCVVPVKTSVLVTFPRQPSPFRKASNRFIEKVDVKADSEREPRHSKLHSFN